MQGLIRWRTERWKRCDSIVTLLSNEVLTFAIVAEGKVSSIGKMPPMSEWIAGQRKGKR
jgi:hypothetical protein